MKNVHLPDSTQDADRSPSGWIIIWRELVRDKLAFISLVFLTLIMVFVYGVSLFLDQKEIVTVDLFSIHKAPSKEFWLGTDYGGRDVFGQLIIGTRNSLSIGILVTVMTGVIGITVGLISGYYGGKIDNIVMRIVDFFMILPFLMIVIVFVSVSPKYTILTFSLIMTAFLWMGKARLIRSKALQERELDYVQASKTLGSLEYKNYVYTGVTEFKFNHYRFDDIELSCKHWFGIWAILFRLWFSRKYAKPRDTCQLCKKPTNFGVSMVDLVTCITTNTSADVEYK